MMSIFTSDVFSHFMPASFCSILHCKFRAMSKQPEEVPVIPLQPEVIPPQEPAGPGWPLHNPEVIPGEEPSPDLAPEEIPAPPTESNRFILIDHECK